MFLECRRDNDVANRKLADLCIRLLLKDRCRDHRSNVFERKEQEISSSPGTCSIGQRIVVGEERNLREGAPTLI